MKTNFQKHLVKTIVSVIFIIAVSWIPQLQIEAKASEHSNQLENYDYNRGYNKGYSLGSTSNSALFGSNYSSALNNDQFDYAEGLLDGYNAGKVGGPTSSGQGNGNPTSGGCKIVINDQALTDYLNTLGFGCYVNFN